MRKKLNIPSHILYIIGIYILGMFVFSLFRVMLLLDEMGRLKDIPPLEWSGVIVKAFLMGLRFDSVISGYVLFFIFLVLFVLMIAGVRRRRPYLLIHWFILVLYFLSFLLCAIDIPFFKQFFSRLSVTALLWTDSPGFVAKMILQEPRYFWTAMPLIFFCVGFYFAARWIFRKTLVKGLALSGQRISMGQMMYSVCLSLVILFLLFVGIRGRLAQKSPIRVGTAYFSNYAFPNQLGLNPVFTFLNSLLESSKMEVGITSGLSDEEALISVKHDLGIKANINDDRPLSRFMQPDTLSMDKHNVVLVIMESMSAAKMERYGNPLGLTPFLDSLATQGYAFDSIFTAGTHTYNGVYASLFAYPTLYNIHTMKGVNMLKYHGLASVLKEQGYNSIYFTTHDAQFDNIGGFLSNNDFGRIVSQKDYPRSMVKSTLGVSDDVLFRFSIPILNALAGEGKPFLSVYLTASDHGPYVIPDYFHPKHEKIKEQAVEYADWSIQTFIDQCKKQSWFDNTLFVFVADHGAPLDAVYDMPLSYHHTPLILYGPSILQAPEACGMLGGQIDVFPTIMGILKLPYVNNTLGIDLISQQRPCIYFSSDDKIGVLDHEYFLVIRKNGQESLYHYPDNDLGNHLEQEPERAARLKKYALTHLQTALWIMKNRKTALK
jgi:phosphoglycerol transferase MdoB-like AlkP superfamily enzyme